MVSKTILYWLVQPVVLKRTVVLTVWKLNQKYYIKSDKMFHFLLKSLVKLKLKI